MSRFLDVLLVYDEPAAAEVAEKLGATLTASGLTAELVAATATTTADSQTLVWSDTVVGVLAGSVVPEMLQLALSHGKRVVLLAPAALGLAEPTAVNRVWSPADVGELGRWLLDLCSQQRDYVRYHTEFLVRSLDWVAHGRSPERLLQGEQCQRAKTWLIQPPQVETPPCLPTDLQAEFITASIRRAENDLVQVCVAHSPADAEAAATLERQLRRAGLTTGMAPMTEPDPQQLQLLEQADNLVLLVSAAGLGAAACAPVLDRALALGKRVVPVLLEPVAALPLGLQALSSLEFAALQSPENALVERLRSHASYHEWHKKILVKALAWEAQQRPRPLLLQGGEFTIARDWLEQADASGSSHPPTQLHRLYIAASEALNQFYDAFISYGRIDSKAFVQRLYERLTAQGYRIWLDQSDIPLAVDFQEQINVGIEKCHNFLYIISPHAVRSPYCAKELELAKTHGKRIIPVMHVEEIDDTTWRQRNPGGSPSQWQHYKASGAHSSYPNLDPEVSRLNWLFARDEQDDADLALQGLTEILERHRSYVHQHTHLLNKALYWERHQRQPRYLLTGQDRIDAEAWLEQSFEGDQVPCEPTPLHAEFICGSRKYAEGWMTQVFLAHSEADREVEEQVRLSLMRAGITVWSSKVDIPYGKDFQREIARGIENTDSVLILLSITALESPYCQQELNLAFQLNKRVIPVLIQPLEAVEAHFQGSGTAAELFQRLQRLQLIDATAVAAADAPRHTLDRVQQLLQSNNSYYREHKELLVRALKWERQQQNPSILLRGALLRYYQSWAEVANRHPQHPPTQLQQTFLQQSLRQPPELTLDVFISCAPQDLEFARKLNDVLQVQGKTTWFPYESLGISPDAGEIRQELERSENVVVLLSPAWLASEAAQRQLTDAIATSKRLLPVIYETVPPSQVPESLRTQPTVDFQGAEDFLTAFGQLYRLLESDPDHVKGHTRLLVKARDWEQSGYDDSFLLRGKELKAATLWQRLAASKLPPPTALQQRYIHTSQELPRRRVQRRTVVGSGLVAGLVATVLRLLGGLEVLELNAYDAMLRLRPSEATDERMLLITVDNASGSWLREQMKAGVYEPGIGTIPDAALAEGLQWLQQGDPALVGLDFYRDFEAEPELARQLEQMQNLVALCKATYAGEGVMPPPELSIEQVGFNDFVSDRHQMIRRHLVKQEADPPSCATEDSFSLQLARGYLQRQQQDYVDPWGDGGFRDLRLGAARVPELWASGLLTSHSGAYSPLRSQRLRGYQTMLNYRAVNGDATAFAPRRSLAELLQRQIPPEEIADRIVIIGYEDVSDRSTDYHGTPYGSMTGLFVQGQMTSQLVSATMDDRPLIWWWPVWGDTLWILGWSLVGGAVAWVVVRPSYQGLAALAAALGLGGICYGTLVVSGGWLPLIPALLGGGGAAAIVSYFTYRVRHPRS